MWTCTVPAPWKQASGSYHQEVPAAHRPSGTQVSSAGPPARPACSKGVQQETHLQSSHLCVGVQMWWWRGRQGPRSIGVAGVPEAHHTRGGEVGGGQQLLGRRLSRGHRHWWGVEARVSQGCRRLVGVQTWKRGDGNCSGRLHRVLLTGMEPPHPHPGC